MAEVENQVVDNSIEIENQALEILLKGADGITPHIGTNGNWYIGDTDTGYPSRGEDGTDGDDGISPIATITQTSNGATIIITDKNGTTTADITNGTNGTDGQDGYTPVRGTDYWTAQDIATIEGYIDTQLGLINNQLATLTEVEE